MGEESPAAGGVMEEKPLGMFRGDDHYQTVHYNDVMIATKTPRGWFILQGASPPKEAYRAIANAVWGTNNSASAGDLAERANAEIHGKRDAQA